MAMQKNVAKAMKITLRSLCKLLVSGYCRNHYEKEFIVNRGAPNGREIGS
jgi:hypothetical protein